MSRVTDAVNEETNATGEGSTVTRTEPIERRPTRLSGRFGVVAGLVAAAAAGLYSPTGGATALVGLAVLAGGLFAGTRRLVSIGAAGAFAGVLYAGVAGAPAVALLVGVAASVIAWDAAGTAVDLGDQLGREADTARLEAVHAAGSLVVGTAAAGVGYAVYLTAAGGQPTTALLLLLVAGLLLLAAFERS